MEEKIAKLVENYRNEIVQSLQKLIKIRSVQEKAEPEMPFGPGVNEVLETSLELASNLDLKTYNLAGYAGYTEIGEGPGLLGVLCHLDVVPEGRDWSHPPFGAEIEDGRIYGRGTIDNKGPAVAALFALKVVEESGYQLKNRVRLILGTNEESGWQGLNYYLENEESPDIGFSPDAEFPVIHGEKGILTFTLTREFNNLADEADIIIRKIKGGNASNMVPDYCTAELEVNNLEALRQKIADFTANTDYQLELKEIENSNNLFQLISEGISAHASIPEKGRNAVSQLFLFLHELNLPDDELKSFVDFYANKIGMEYHGESLGCSLQDDLSGPLTLNMGIVDLDREKGELVINVRYPVTLTREDVYAPLRELITAEGLKLTENSHKEPLYLPADDPLVTGLMEVYRRFTGDQSEPITIGGGTYARALKKAVAFGPLFPGQEELAHQKDEYISIDDLLLLTRIYAASIIELDQKYGG